MTESDAKRELKRKLVFGDERQIKALRLLDNIAACVEQMRDNPECEYCGGTGVNCFLPEVSCPTCYGLGIFIDDWPDFSEEVLRAAKRRIKYELRRQFA